MEASPKITVIPPRIRMSAEGTTAMSATRRVAAYARVSTDSDEQFTSFEAQVEYYTKQINANPNWSMVKVYTDAPDIIGLNQNLARRAAVQSCYPL